MLQNSNNRFILRRPCRHPGCGALVEAPATRCPTHQVHARIDRRQRDRFRGSAHERGYDARWRTASRGFLARYPLCIGVLIPTESWSRALAEQFHVLRERAREAGEVLYLSPRAPAVGRGLALSSQLSALRFFLEQHPIYRVEPWDVERASVVVDHIIPHKGDMDLFWSEWNWQPLTKRAHDRKTAAEDRGAWSPALNPQLSTLNSVPFPNESRT